MFFRILILVGIFLNSFSIAQKIESSRIKVDLSNIEEGSLLTKQVHVDRENGISIRGDDNFNEVLFEVLEVPIENPEPFLAFSIIADFDRDIPSCEFYVKFSEDNTFWSDWIEIEEQDLDIMNTKNYKSDLIFLPKSARYIQIKNIFSKFNDKYSTLENLEYYFISPGATDSDLFARVNSESREFLENKSSSYTRPPYVTRTEWGCPQAENVSSRTLTTVTHLVLHHSAGSTYSSDFPAVVRSYWNLHVNVNGWADIGYNWLVDRNGVLYKGRAWKTSTQENVQGAHNSGKNGNTSGICYIGNYDEYSPAQSGLDMVIEIMAFLCDKFNIQPKEKSYHAALGKTNDNITGHQHSGGGTACPGVNLISKYNYIRNEVYNKLNPTDIQEDEGQLISEYKLYQNYPNPFNPTTKVKYTIPKSETGEVNKVTLIVYDIMGREIETLVNENKSSGTYEIEFNASNLVSGIYFYRLKIANFISIKKMIYLK